MVESNGVHMRLRWARRLSFVPRWSVMPTLRQQNVAEHTFHVAHTALWLLPLHAEGTDAYFRLKCLEYGLTHDEDEAIFGDRPSPNKKRVCPHSQPQYKVLVKCADILESLAFVAEERAMGNSTMTGTSVHDMRKFREWWKEFDGIEKEESMNVVTRYLNETRLGRHPIIDDAVYVGEQE